MFEKWVGLFFPLLATAKLSTESSAKINTTSAFAYAKSKMMLGIVWLRILAFFKSCPSKTLATIGINFKKDTNTFFKPLSASKRKRKIHPRKKEEESWIKFEKKKI